MNTFFAFALAIGSSFASIQGFRIYYNKRKNKNQVRLIFYLLEFFNWNNSWKTKLNCQLPSYLPKNEAQ